MTRLFAWFSRRFGAAPEASLDASDRAGDPKAADAGTASVERSVLAGDPPAFVVVGLGNPGDEYADTRHNIGFRVVEALATRWGLAWQAEPSCEARIARGPFADRDVLLVLPQTFMNGSGRSVEALRVEWPELAPAQFLVVFDDMDLPTGRIRLRPSGGGGGHRGIGDILAVLDDRGVPRLRFGVGHPGEAGQAVLDHVLSPFAVPEATVLSEAVERSVQAIEVVLADGLSEAMGQFNGK